MRIALPAATINALTYERERYPVFLLLTAVCFVLAGLAAQPERPSYGDYELANWPWWVAGGMLAFVLYLLVQSASVVVASGTTRTILRGSRDTLLHVFLAVQKPEQP